MAWVVPERRQPTEAQMAKKNRASKPPSGGKEIEIEFGGRKIKGVAKEFEAEKEAWNVYRLDDGSVVKIRILVQDIVLTKEKNPDGSPLIVVRQGIIITYDPVGA